MAVIEIAGLTRDYGQGKGVFDLSLTVDRGEALGFLGPNGAGKTTAIRHLMGFLRPQAGSVRIDGRDCWTQAAQVQRDVGYIPGEITFFPTMTGHEYLRFVARYRGLDGPGRAAELLDRFELDAGVVVKKMSKGMKQKVGIVAALIHDPDILVLDEPSSGLDPLMQSRFLELVNEEKARGKTILMSSHTFDEVERSCHRVGIIKAGRLVALDSLAALRAQQVRTYAVTLDSPAAAHAFAAEPLDVAATDGATVTVAVRDMAAFTAALARHPVVNLTNPEQSLEDVFMQYYRGEGDGAMPVGKP